MRTGTRSRLEALLADNDAAQAQLTQGELDRSRASCGS